MNNLQFDKYINFDEDKCLFEAVAQISKFKHKRDILRVNIDIKEVRLNMYIRSRQNIFDPAREDIIRGMETEIAVLNSISVRFEWLN